MLNHACTLVFRLRSLAVLGLSLCAGTLAAQPAGTPLIVVEDHGGSAAQPYYEALDLQPRAARPASPPRSVPMPQIGPVDEAAMLPVRSARLAPGTVSRRTIQAAGLSPLFLVGDDERSRAWLRQRVATLRDLNATGLVVNVESASGLAALRTLVPGLTLTPTSGDDLAERLNLRHYPVLITASGIEQ
ncbi:integrating conjugative element protein [Achromobacter pestifer]|uniref:Integrating conjugative element protein n=1 Tax=Achromobacter pestifer TaxID=1353889 RepID=A0A6S6YV93_9BURK|nr:integrating conjugative element protein [Achromobacter pestifer]CAB3647896.1 hypothetical protein LMG3431_02609 [Achromobacter pestifer]